MTKMSHFASNIMKNKYSHVLPDGSRETWNQIADRTALTVLGAVDCPDEMKHELAVEIRDRAFMPGGRYLYASGRTFHQTQNCLLLRAEDSREGWAELLQKSAMALMTGAGIGVDYSEVRCKGAAIKKTGGTATGPIALMKMLNECGRGIMQGGSRRSAIWAGLVWSHADIAEFIRVKDWAPEIKAMKEKDFSAVAPMDMTNISVILDDEFFAAYDNASHPKHALAKKVYWDTVEHMLETGEPGFSVNVGENAGESLRNACTEVTSRDDSDVCNLGSINMAKVRDLAHFERLLELSTAFLVAGTVYSDLPYGKVSQVRDKNRRLGLGLMGIHEWMLQRGKKYGPDADLEEYLKLYAQSTERANRWCAHWGLSPCVKTRAIAPTGTIGIVAETTTGMEPVFCAAYKRRFLDDGSWKYQYVIDPIAKRLVDGGTSPDDIEDAYSIDSERRVSFQAWLQQYVDHSISSTVNLPEWGSPENCAATVQSFGKMLMKYLPQLRGITCYPDGARGGQPLNRVKYQTAMKHEGEVFVEQADICDITGAGTCGS